MSEISALERILGVSLADITEIDKRLTEFHEKKAKWNESRASADPKVRKKGDADWQKFAYGYTAYVAGCRTATAFARAKNEVAAPAEGSDA